MKTIMYGLVKPSLRIQHSLSFVESLHCGNKTKQKNIGLPKNAAEIKFPLAVNIMSRLLS